MKRKIPSRPFPKRHEPTVTPQEHAEARAARIAAQRPGLTLHKAVMGPARLTAAPKSEPKRNQALLDMAEGRECLLRVPGVCTNDTATTVACHRNEGKGMGQKQSDAMSCWGCAACHAWYDRSGAPRTEKRTRFMLAHADQVVAWGIAATDPTEPERFRRASRWALEQLGSTFIEAVEAAERSCL